MEVGYSGGVAIQPYLLIYNETASLNSNSNGQVSLKSWKHKFNFEILNLPRIWPEGPVPVLSFQSKQKSPAKRNTFGDLEVPETQNFDISRPTRCLNEVGHHSFTTNPVIYGLCRSFRREWLGSLVVNSVLRSQFTPMNMLT
jgi:hypothetical protein